VVIMKYMMFDERVTADEDSVSGTQFVAGFLAVTFLLLLLGVLILPFYCKQDIFLYFFVWLSDLFFTFLVLYSIPSILWKLREYELSGEGIGYNYAFGKGTFKWEDVLCYGLFPAIDSIEKCQWYIIIFLTSAPPRYPIPVDQDPRFGRLTRLEIKYTDKRFEEIKRFADQNEIPFIGKEGNGRRYEYSSWFKELDGKTVQSIESPSSLRLQKGVDDPKRDGARMKFYWGLAIAATIIIAAMLALLIKWLIDDFSPYGVVDIGIVVIAGIVIIPWIIRQNDMYELREDGVFLKKGTSHTLVKWDNIKYCGVVPAGYKEKSRIKVSNAYILVSLEQKMPTIPLDINTNILLHGNDRILINTTYLRIQEFRRHTEQRRIRWIDCYDDDGILSLPEGMKKKQSY